MVCGGFNGDLLKTPQVSELKKKGLALGGLGERRLRSGALVHTGKVASRK